ncbi:hypothetical protein Hypma_006113 [Hypsizygus marmoreus]|uniref:Fungal-type protein kinase domain-containing protein n=1 Tax=Hypsizygus marmoreus TaxID=39966 RepID=A0A369K527_HYPMA|nr:hypothetical protein Hypma_006113 [Hypsizygus marmoreus]
MGTREIRHCRLILACRTASLKDVSTAKDLVSVVRDAAHGLYQRKSVHGDISPMNIRMTRAVNGSTTGFLFDWDISKTGNVGPPRLGTWQFMAIRLLQYTDERRAPSLVDDVESFSHVMAWMALRYAKHSFPTLQLSDIIYQNFESSYTDRGTGRTYISDAKEMYLTSSTWLVNANFSNDGILAVLENVTSVVSQRTTLLRTTQNLPGPLHSSSILKWSRRGLLCLPPPSLSNSRGWRFWRMTAGSQISLKTSDSPDIDWDTNGELKGNETTDPPLRPHTHKRSQNNNR